MVKVHIDGVLLTPLCTIDASGGNVMQGMKINDPGYAGFGEAYFSVIEARAVKGWKRHRKMTLNLVVPIGAVRFVIHDDRSSSATHEKFQEVTLCKDNYQRLTVPPMVWLAFQGVSDLQNILLNVASLEHDPNEVDRKSIHDIPFNW